MVVEAVEAVVEFIQNGCATQSLNTFHTHSWLRAPTAAAVAVYHPGPVWRQDRERAYMGGGGESVCKCVYVEGGRGGGREVGGGGGERVCVSGFVRKQSCTFAFVCVCV